MVFAIFGLLYSDIHPGCSQLRPLAIHTKIANFCTETPTPWPTPITPATPSPTPKIAKFCSETASPSPITPATPSPTPPDRGVVTDFLINKCGMTEKDVSNALQNKNSKGLELLKERLELSNGRFELSKERLELSKERLELSKERLDTYYGRKSGIVDNEQGDIQ